MLLALLLGSVLSLSAQQVTQEAALKKAEQFLGKASLSRRAPHKAPQLTLANNRDEFYVFNDKANGGYVIVSGEERMPDVLAYSYDSRFDADNMPCNMKAWLEGYAELVKYLRTHPEASARRTTTERENVGPLLTCWFNQDTYYWNKCPEVNGEHCFTGCTATAMAQIMYYWKWPKQTTDVIPGYTTGTLEIDMPAIPVTTIDWDNILNKYYWYRSYTEEQTDAISTLMLLCGVSAKMDYSPGGSGASLVDASKAFRNYFDYDDMLEYFSRFDSTEDWEQLVYDELKSKRPVLYDGYPTDGIGHAFVLDGYKDGYFHVNWGWGGEEAYVLMTDADGWEGFTDGQHAVVGIQPASADYPSRYAVFDNGKMTLYYDKKKSSRSGTVLSHQEDWVNYAEEITECVIDKSFANLKQRDLQGYFGGFKNLKSIKGLEFLDTSETLNMEFMFGGCSSLTSLDVSGFKTDNVISMQSMFWGCSGLTELDVSSFKTDNLKNMFYMFYGCSGLTSLDLSGFKTDNARIMTSMFDGCSGLKELDVSGFNTASVTEMSYMFRNCSSLTSLDVSGFKTDKVKRMGSMFDGCSGLKELDVSGFKTDNVTNMSWMFARCNKLSTIYASERWDMSNVETTDNMFYNCEKLVGGAETAYTWDFINGEYARIDEGPSKPGYFTEKAPQYYTITYMVDDEEYKSLYLEVGTAITAEVEPSKEGYTFSGWSEIPETMPAHDVTVTGTFSVNKYKLIYMVDGEEYKTSEVEYGTTITAEEEPTKEGYTFSGWSEIPETMPAHDVTVTGTFEKNIIMGDVNGDGVVNVTDIVATVNYIMEKPIDGFNKDAADLNGDGDINVTDIVKMVSIIMSGDGGSSRRAAATSGKLVISGHHIQLKNAENYIAAQFDINLSDGQSISDIVLNGSSNHDLYWKMINANTCRVVVYSMTNTAFRVNGDNLFNIFINGGQRATISNELLIKAENTTGIDAIRKESENGKVYDLNGRQVNSPRKGVYIINGRKVLVK